MLIPCFNEALTVGRVVRDFQALLPSARVYVYDNNSSDNTAHEALEAGAIVRREELQGKGNVVRRMFRDVEADLYVLVDGDGTYDAARVLDMLDLARRGPYDLVNGVRVDDKAGDEYRMGHRMGNDLLTGTVGYLFGDRIRDMLSGYKVLSRRFVKSFPVLSAGFEIETELAVHALELDMPIAHVEGRYTGRPTGSTSKLNTIEDGQRILLAIVELFKQERPLQFFASIAFVLTLLSLGLGIPVVLDYLRTGLVPRFPTAILSLGLMLLAFASLACGLILDTVTRGRREAKLLRYLSIPAVAPSVGSAREEGQLPTLAEIEAETTQVLPVATSGRSILSRILAHLRPAVATRAAGDPSYALLLNPWVSVGLLVAFMALFARLSVHMGEDFNWDLLNYHFYNGYAALTGAWQHNYAPAQLQSYFTPTLDVVTYLLISKLQPVQVGLVVGAFQGINAWLVVQIAARLIRFRWHWLEWPVWLACAALAMYSPISVTELGNSMQDLTLSVLILGAILLLVIATGKQAGQARSAWILFTCAGLLLGVAVGAKYTEAMYAIAAFVTFVITPNKQGLLRGLSFTLAGTVGALTMAGYWMYDMATRFGNPVFPLYNGVFKSPYANPYNYADTRFEPKNLSDGLLSPFWFTNPTAHQTMEIPFQNLGFAVAYILLIFAILVQVGRLVLATDRAHGNGTGGGTATATHRNARVRLVVFCFISFVMWVLQFSIYRYLSPVELLLPIVIVVLACWVVAADLLQATLVLFVFIFTATTMFSGSWSRLPWSNSYFHVQQPALVEEHALVVLDTGAPVSFAIPYFPASTQFVSVESNFQESGLASARFQADERAVIANFRGDMYTVTPWPENVRQQVEGRTDDQVLAPYGLAVVHNSCVTIMPFQRPVSGDPFPGLFLCQLQRVAPASSLAAQSGGQTGAPANSPGA